MTTTADAHFGIGQTPNAAQVGIDHAAANAALGSANATSVTVTPAAGLTNAPDAAQVGIDHATEAMVGVGIRRP